MAASSNAEPGAAAPSLVTRYYLAMGVPFAIDVTTSIVYVLINRQPLVFLPMVAMARSVGLPARDVYGIRVAPSKFGYKSLGAGSQTITKAQHCRAEVWLSGSGWTPIDPADVRKVVLEEPPTNLSLTDLKVLAARKTLFGAWEGNWVAFNVAHDVKLPGSSEDAIPFLMYPQAEDKSGLIDPLDADAFKYKITATEVSV